MDISILLKKVTRILAIFIFTLLEILSLPRIPHQKVRREKEKG